VAKFVIGDIVIVPFPFSATEGSKRRPALVVASWPFENSTDYLLAMITSKAADDPYTTMLEQSHFEQGSLARTSYLRPSYLFAIDEPRIARAICHLNAAALATVFESIRNLFVTPEINHDDETK
jgi:mRNA interferase MazF